MRFSKSPLVPRREGCAQTHLYSLTRETDGKVAHAFIAPNVRNCRRLFARDATQRKYTNGQTQRDAAFESRTTTGRATRVHSSSDISRYKLQATRVDTDRLVTYVTPRGGEDKYDRALSRRRHARTKMRERA